MYCKIFLLIVLNTSKVHGWIFELFTIFIIELFKSIAWQNSHQKMLQFYLQYSLWKFVQILFDILIMLNISHIFFCFYCFLFIEFIWKLSWINLVCSYLWFTLCLFGILEILFCSGICILSISNCIEFFWFFGVYLKLNFPRIHLFLRIRFVFVH